MVERFHRQLKTAIKCHETDSWAEVLPVIMMGIRAAWKEDLEATRAELMFGHTIRLLGEFLEIDKEYSHEEIKDYVDQLRANMRKLQPRLKRHGQNTTFQFKELKSASHVFIRRDVPTRTLQPSYEGPYEVLQNKGKILKVKKEEKVQNVSADRVKPAYLMQEAETKEKETPRTKEGPITRSKAKKTVRFKT